MEEVLAAKMLVDQIIERIPHADFLLKDAAGKEINVNSLMNSRVMVPLEEVEDLEEAEDGKAMTLAVICYLTLHIEYQ